jgi:radical SAM protein with 4Fe4S-binding SPASM domain
MGQNTTYHDDRARFVDLLYNSAGMLPRRYVFVLTNRCNLKCDFCPQDKSTLAATMTGNDWIALLDQLPSYATVTLTGGEPLLFPEFEAVLAAIVERFPCNIITNGLLLTPELLDRILRHNNLKVLSLSIDDIGNTVRGLSEGQWQQLVANCAVVREVRNSLHAELVFDIKTVVLDKNAEHLAAIHSYCMETLRCDTHCFQFLKGSRYQHADTMVAFDTLFEPCETDCYTAWGTICEQMELIRRYNRTSGRSCYCHPKVFDLNGEGPITCQTGTHFNLSGFDPAVFAPCKAPWESVHINADGTLFPCLSVAMGNVREQSLQEIVFSNKFERFRTSLRDGGLFPACRRCGYLQISVGVSP